MKTETFSCDIDLSKCTQDHSGYIVAIKVPVMFDHDQDDGRTKTIPYFEMRELDLCERCFNQMTRKRELIYGDGAMGHNTYKLSNDA